VGGSKRSPLAELHPGDRVRSREHGRTGTVMPYGWTPVGGEWRHGPLAPVLWQTGVTSMVGAAHVETIEASA
jgi:hypothetical protein